MKTITEVRGPTSSEKMWVIGLTLATIVGLIIIGYCLMRFRRWLKSDITTSSTGSSFSLNELKAMNAKGHISNEEYAKLKQAYINSKL